MRTMLGILLACVCSANAQIKLAGNIRLTGWLATAFPVFTNPPIMVVQDAKLIGDADAISAHAKAFTNDNTAGNLIVAIMNSNSVGTETPTIADTAGNTYTAINTIKYWGSNQRMYQWWYATNIAAGANTVTVTTSAGRNFCHVHIIELAGAALSSPLADHVETAGYQGVQISGTITTTTANNLLIGTSTDFLHNTITVQTGPAWITLQTVETYLYHKQATNATTYAMISTNSAPAGNDWLNSVAAFKP